MNHTPTTIPGYPPTYLSQSAGQNNPDDIARQLAYVTATLTQVIDALSQLSARVVDHQMHTQAQFFALNQRITALASLATQADNQTHVDALAEQMKALSQAAQLQLKDQEDRLASLSRTIAHFNEQERYAITRAMVTRILAEGTTP